MRSLPGPESTSDSFCHCSSEGPGTTSALALSSLAFSFDFFLDFFFILFFFFFFSLCFARFFLLCRLFFALGSLSLESSEEELEEDEDEEELEEEDVSEEDVLAFLFFLLFPSFFFSAMHKERVSRAALAPWQQGFPLSPAVVAALLSQPEDKVPGANPLCAATWNTSGCGALLPAQREEGAAGLCTCQSPTETGTKRALT